MDSLSTVVTVVTDQSLAAFLVAHWSYVSQAPLIIFFIVSLLDTPVDVAIQRLVTCYGLPLLLLLLLSMSWYWSGVLVAFALWFGLTSAVPFSPIRIPSGKLKKAIRQIVRLVNYNHLLEDSSHSDMTNPFAVTAYIDVIRPLVFAINRTGRWLFGAPPNRIIRVSEVSWLFLVINYLGRQAKSMFKVNVVFPFAKSGLLARARASANLHLLDDETDETEKGIRLFVSDIERRGTPVSATGRLLLNNLLMGIMDVRVSASKFIKLHPEARSIAIKRPLIIVGLPRTGSTFLLSLLAQDVGTRHLRFWEMNWPIPPPKESTYYTDFRIAAQDTGMSAIDLVCPAYIDECAKNHVIAASTIEEELLILHHNFLLFSHYFLTGYDSKFSQWFLDGEGKQHAYKYMRMFLQVLSFNYNPKSHWVLKAPIHSLYIETLLAEFPDACIINTHRDPKEVVVSWTKFQMQMLSIYCESSFDGTKEFASMTRQMCELMIDRVMKFRKAMDPEQERKKFVDVRIQDLSKDPIGTVKRIYKHFDLTFTEEYEQRLVTYIAEHGTGDGGRSKPATANPLHAPFLIETRGPSSRIDLDALGQSDQILSERFAEYTATYLSNGPEDKQ